MYGRNGKITAQPGKRADLVRILVRAAELVTRNPACKMYLVGEDTADEDAVWVLEAWNSSDDHRASLTDERVLALIAEARPVIRGISDVVELRLKGRGTGD